MPCFGSVMQKTRRRGSAKSASRRRDHNSNSGQNSARAGGAGVGEGPSRVNLLKHKLETLRQQALAALQSGDLRTKSWLDAEAAQLNATILRAETVVGRMPK